MENYSMIPSKKENESIGKTVNTTSFVAPYFPECPLLASLSQLMIKDGKYSLKEVNAVFAVPPKEDVGSYVLIGWAKQTIKDKSQLMEQIMISGISQVK